MYRKHLILLTVLLAFGLAVQTFAAGTPAGTVITNKAYGGYSDANGNVIADVDNPATRIESDEVSTTVSQVYGVDIESDQGKNLPRNQSVTYALTVENTGNGTDTFDLTQITNSTGSSTFTVHIYHDTDGDGVWDGLPAEPEVSATSALAADATYNLVVVVAVTDGAQGEVATTTVTATSQGSGSINDASVLTSTVQAALMAGTLAPDATTKNPNDVITYTLNYSNSNNANSETAYGVSVALPVPPNCTWVGNVMLNGAPTGTGEGVPVSVGNVAKGGTGTITYQVRVNAGVPSGTTIDNQVSIDYNDSASDPYPQVVAYANAGTGGRVTVNEVNSFTTAIAPAAQSGDPGDVVRYLVSVTNTGNGSDSYNLTLTSSSQGWSWTFYIDDDDNGVWNGTEPLATNTGAVSSGSSQGMWAVATIPAGTADAVVDASVFRFTSVDNGAFGEQTGTTTVTAPVLSLDKAVNPSGDQPPGTTLTYTVDVINSGTGNATNVVIKDAIPANTTYVTGSMLIGVTPQTDASDSPTDESECNGSTAIFGVGTVATGVTVTVQFQVTID
jgi:uncharacterized repeat protein (TIGR01451 family)